MATVAQTQPARKAYYAHLFHQAGMLFQHVDGRLMFLDEATDRISTVEPDMVNFLTVLGRVDVANTQRLDDLAHGGAAAIACTRQHAVA